MAMQWLDVWLHGTIEERKKQALTDIHRWDPHPDIVYGKTFFCNICRKSKSGTPKAVGGDEYTSRYYCNTCCVGLGLAW